MHACAVRVMIRRQTGRVSGEQKKKLLYWVTDLINNWTLLNVLMSAMILVLAIKCLMSEMAIYLETSVCDAKGMEIKSSDVSE